MPEENLKQKSVDDLLILLSTAQRNLELSKIYKHGAVVVQQNKTRLEKVQQALLERRGEPVLIKNKL